MKARTGASLPRLSRSRSVHGALHHAPAGVGPGLRPRRGRPRTGPAAGRRAPRTARRHRGGEPHRGALLLEGGSIARRGRGGARARRLVPRRLRAGPSASRDDARAAARREAPRHVHSTPDAHRGAHPGRRARVAIAGRQRGRGRRARRAGHGPAAHPRGGSRAPHGSAIVGRCARGRRQPAGLGSAARAGSRAKCRTRRRCRIRARPAHEPRAARDRRRGLLGAPPPPARRRRPAARARRRCVRACACPRARRRAARRSRRRGWAPRDGRRAHPVDLGPPRRADRRARRGRPVVASREAARRSARRGHRRVVDGAAGGWPASGDPRGLPRHGHGARAMPAPRRGSMERARGERLHRGDAASCRGVGPLVRADARRGGLAPAAAASRARAASGGRRRHDAPRARGPRDERRGMARHHGVRRDPSSADAARAAVEPAGDSGGGDRDSREPRRRTRRRAEPARRRRVPGRAGPV